MKRVAFVAMVCVLGLLCAQTSVAKPGPRVLAFTHVTVIDATGAPARPDSTVVITGNRITALGRTGRVRVPNDATTIDASGKFMIPGLWDMHVHFTETERTFPLFVANGVLGVRNAGGDADQLFRWRAEVAAGTLVGPRIVACGPIVDGPKPVAHGPTIGVGTVAEARRIVDDFKKRGADFIKVYDTLPRDAYFAVIDEARKVHIPVAGHVPLSVSSLEASDAGQRSIEHLGTILEGCSTVADELRADEAAPIPEGDLTEIPRRIAARGERMLATYDEARASILFAHFRRNHTWQVPTLVTKRALAFVDDMSRQPDDRLKYVPAATIDAWRPASNFLSRYRTEGYIDYRKRLYQKELELTGTMRRAGVGFLAGTDLSVGYIFAGFSLHDELELFVKAGFTPMEALQTATRNPAEYLGELSSSGTVERGKVASLVLLDANPLEDITNTRRVDSVVLNGRYFSHEELQRMLASAEAAAK